MSKDKKIRSFTHLKMKNIKKSDLFEEDCVSDVEEIRESRISIKLEKEKDGKVEMDDLRLSNHSSEKEKDERDKKSKKRSWSSLFKLTKQIKKKILNEKT
jgi:hypothetical protein